MISEQLGCIVSELNIQDDYTSFWATAMMGNEIFKFDDYDEYETNLTKDEFLTKLINLI